MTNLLYMEKFEVINVPKSSLKDGFNNGPGGTHTSRTMLLKELTLLLESCPATCDFAYYERAILLDNVLMKQTDSTRRRTLRSMRELYALRREVPLFRALRDLWDEDQDARPLLALQCAAARDPLLRATSSLILELPIRATVSSSELADAVKEAFPDRYNLSTLNKIGRNTASSWTQAGYLEGRTSKTRVNIKPTASSVAYAILQGHLCGERGDALFDTIWTR
ncbi:MAG: hypothetical protein R3293_28770, partial [Candidatus Promineifilaceae bacterium]|nr:hypothetical protein [Candidatus Promineifilaceae bacterium]